jgi:hypothetical protein
MKKCNNKNIRNKIIKKHIIFNLLMNIMLELLLTHLFSKVSQVINVRN